MAGSRSIALGGLASGLAQSLQHQADQEHQDKQDHQRLIQQAIISGLTNNAFDDPNAAFQFLISGGKTTKAKEGKGDLSTGIANVVQNVQGSPHLDDSNPLSGLPGGPAGPPPGVAPGQPYQTPTGATIRPQPAPQPGAAPGGFRYLSTPERDARALSQLYATHYAERGATLSADIDMARRMVQTGVFSNVLDAMDWIKSGRRGGSGAGFQFQPGDPVKTSNIPEEMRLGLNDEYVDETKTPWVKLVIRKSDSQPRYLPASPKTSSAGNMATTDEKKWIAGILGKTHPGQQLEDLPEEDQRQVRAQAQQMMLVDMQNRQQLSEARLTKLNQDLGLVASVIDKVPDAGKAPRLPDGSPDPTAVKAVEDYIAALPQGGSLLPEVQMLASYQMPPTDLTARQLSGENRARMHALAKKLNPNYNPGVYKERFDKLQEWTTKDSPGADGVQMASGQRLVHHLNDMATAAETLSKWTATYPGWIEKGVVNWAQFRGTQEERTAAQQAYTDYQFAQGVVANELKNLLAGTRAGGQAEIDEWRKLADAQVTTSPQQATYIRRAISLMGGRILPLYQRYAAVMGENPGVRGVGFTNDEYDILKDLSGNPNVDKPYLAFGTGTRPPTPSPKPMPVAPVAAPAGAGTTADAKADAKAGANAGQSFPGTPPPQVAAALRDPKNAGQRARVKDGYWRYDKASDTFTFYLNP